MVSRHFQKAGHRCIHLLLSLNTKLILHIYLTLIELDDSSAAVQAPAKPSAKPPANQIDRLKLIRKARKTKQRKATTVAGAIESLVRRDRPEVETEALIFGNMGQGESAPILKFIVSKLDVEARWLTFLTFSHDLDQHDGYYNKDMAIDDLLPGLDKDSADPTKAWFQSIMGDPTINYRLYVHYSW